MNVQKSRGLPTRQTKSPRLNQLKKSLNNIAKPSYISSPTISNNREHSTKSNESCYVWKQTVNASIHMNLNAPNNCIRVLDLAFEDSLISSFPYVINCAGKADSFDFSSNSSAPGFLDHPFYRCFDCLHCSGDSQPVPSFGPDLASYAAMEKEMINCFQF